MISSFILSIQNTILSLDLFEWFAWLSLLYVILRQIITENVVTFEADNPVREHRQRILTGLFYVPFVSIASFYVINAMRLFIMVMIFQGMGEYMRIVFLKRSTSKNKTRVHYKLNSMDRIVQCLSLIPSIGFFYSHILATAILYNVFFLIIVIYICFLIFSPNKKVEMSDFHRIALYWFGIMWIAWPLSHSIIAIVSMKIDGVAYGTEILLIVLLTSWASDVAGYYVGKRIGKTKPIPHISPNKTVQGFVAQVIVGIGFCIGFKLLDVYNIAKFMPVGWIHYLAIGIFISVFGAFGDLLESFIKRMGGVKDSGIFFPGHGGILDRFDTFLLACPVTFYYILYFMTDGPTSLYS